MFIDRRVFNIKVGRMQEALALAKAEHVRIHQKYRDLGTFRYLVGLVADFDTLVFESEWKKFASHFLCSIHRRNSLMKTQIRRFAFVPVLLLGLLPFFTACQPIQPSPATETTAMAAAESSPAEANKAIVQRFYDEVFTQKKMAVLGEIMDANFVVHDLDVGGELNGGAPLEETLAAFPDVKATMNLWVSEGELVAVYVTYKGTHQAEYLNVAATGAPVTWEVIDVWRVKDGKLAELWHNIPNDDILEQIAPQDQ